MNTLSLTKPYIHSSMLKKESAFGPLHEKVNYLKIPGNLELDDLVQDVKLGAVQFSELDKLVEKSSEPRYILLTVDNLEQGYLAVTYLAAAFNNKHEDYADYFNDEELDDSESIIEEWEESPFRIPVIEENELLQQIGGDLGAYGGMPFGMGNMNALGGTPSAYNTPYWFDCGRNSVCIVSKSNYGEYSESFERALGHFCNNDKVYIINVRSEYQMGFFMDDYSDEDNETRCRAKWNSVVLALAADEATVVLDEKQEKKYYKLLFKSVFEAKKIKTEKGFSFERLVNLVKSMNNPDKCKLVENIVKYAIKDREIMSEYLVNNKDFEFIDRFMNANTCKKDSDKKVKARDSMLDKLIGLDDVKQQVLNVVNVMKYNKMRKDLKISGGEYHNVHMMLGAPGTAKTTVAKYMGQIMMEEKLLPDNRFICVNGAELKGKYVGHSAPKTKALFDEHDIIVIDEAYSLVSDRGEEDTFSKEALAQLIIEIENHSTDKLVIFAGYGGKNVSEKNNKMKVFLDANPGLKSRITSTIYFDSYTSEQMVSIFFQIAKNSNYTVDPEVSEIIRKHFENRINCDNFGNGREARSLLETTVIYTANRLFNDKKNKLTKQDMQVIKYEDVEQAIMQIEKANMIQEVRADNKKIGFI